MSATRITDLDALLAVLARGAGVDDGEGLDLLAHSLQCAANVARNVPDDVELQVAGLVHDIGTVLDPGHPESHARTGGDAVGALLGARVAALVAQHAVAKRYLVTVDAGYERRLSPKSVATLAVQGGVLDDRELAAFEARADRDACVALRRADDAAKVAGRVVPALDHWRPALEECAATRR
ncbi:MAG TPA: metal-dependent phosphohydrolase [Acidimicrobiia bacterium]|jgi:predicted HD phosphohydrolase